MAKKKRKKLSIYMRHQIRDHILIPLIMQLSLLLFLLPPTFIEAAPDNTETILYTLQNITYKEIVRKAGSGSLMFQDATESYRCSYVAFSSMKREKGEMIDADVLNAEPCLILTVKLDEEKSLFYGTYRDVVDVRTDSKVYFDILAYNRYQRLSKTVSMIMAIVVYLLFGVCFGLFSLISFFGAEPVIRARRRFFKKLRKRFGTKEE